jgi:peptidoglycan/LPS O-acetylase OafA/YrhL
MPALDGIRGLAILMVLSFHIANPFRPPNAGGLGGLLTKPLSWGWVGVDLFFVLSGFLITGILLDTKDSSNYFRSFYVRRVLRIFPLYYGALVAWFFVVPWLMHTTGAPYVGRDHQAWYWLYVSNWTQARVDHIAHLWSLSVEEQFYLAWPLVVYLLSARRLLYLCLGTVAFSLVLRALLMAHGMPIEIVHRITPARIDSLAAGAIVAVMLRDKSLCGKALSLSHGVFGGIVAALHVLTGLVSAGFQYASLPVQTVGYTFLSAAFAWLILRTLASDGSGAWQWVVKSRFLQSFGKYSYGIYVFHYTLNVMALNALTLRPGVQKLLGLGWPFAVAYVTTAVAATYALALVSFHFYERPFLALKTHFVAIRAGGATPDASGPEMAGAPSAPPSA